MKPIALVDLDRTLADYDEALQRDFDLLCSPNEEKTQLINDDESYIKNRINLIRNQPNWWFNLKPIKSGFDVYNLFKELDYDIHILSKGPWSSPNAWTEKYNWCRKYLGDDIQVTVCAKKSLVYGKVLFDDYPDYAVSWLEHRPRGLVIMPQNERNSSFFHPNVLKYNNNLEEIRNKLIEIRNKSDK